MLSHALWQSISSRDCRVITERRLGHSLMYCAGLWDKEEEEEEEGSWERTGGRARLGVKDGDGENKWLADTPTSLHSSQLDSDLGWASFATFCPLNNLSIKHNLTTVWAHTYTHITLLTGCHSAVIWLSVSKNLHASGVGNLETIVCVVSGNTLSPSYPRVWGRAILQKQRAATQPRYNL